MDLARRTGTREWSDHSHNIFLGCKHGCRYCYARNSQVKAGRVRPEEWGTMRIMQNRLHQVPKQKTGVIMFPTLHDIMPIHIDVTIAYLRRWLEAGNKILIVSKPHLEVIAPMVNSFMNYREQILFRFSIGSMIPESLAFWEPGAPTFNERIACLHRAFTAGFETSVSCEPYLDASIVEVFNTVRNYVTETIWFGTMNNIYQRVDMKGWGEEERGYLREVEKVSSKDWLTKYLWGDLKIRLDEKVRWKDSIQRILGIDVEGNPI